MIIKYKEQNKTRFLNTSFIVSAVISEHYINFTTVAGQEFSWGVDSEKGRQLIEFLDHE